MMATLFKHTKGNKMTKTNRETWLNELAAMMAPRFKEMGFPVPPFRVAVGFTSAGKTAAVAGECWHSSRSADGVFEILLSPVIDDSMLIAGTLAHELTHAAVGFHHKHKGDFAKVVLALGLNRPLTATTPGPKFIEWATPFLEKLGPIPHAKLSWNSVLTPVPGAEGGEGGEDDGPGAGSSNAKKKQSTRMLKATCTADVDGQPCGYTVRLSKKWAQKLGACCPAHGALEVEGADGAPADDESDSDDE